jgi:hypothetical protein
MMEDIEKAPSGSVILLHGCAHNPTGKATLTGGLINSSQIPSKAIPQ